MLRLCGAELVEVPALPYANPNSTSTSERGLPRSCARASRTACYFADQWNNLDNARRITNRPVRNLAATGGKIDGFICSVGTGGTLAGTSRYLKEKHKGIVNACAIRTAPGCMNCSSTARSR